MKKYLFLLSILAVFACENSSKNENPELTSVEEITEETEVSPDIDFSKAVGKLEANISIDGYGNPKTQVFLEVTLDGVVKNFPINSATGEGVRIDPADYERFKIPPTSISTMSCFYAGLQSLYYLEKTAEGFVCYVGFEDEGVPPTYPEKDIRTFTVKDWIASEK